MTQQYEMPPLPKLPMNDPAAAHKILNDYGKACANAAIKADRKRRGNSNECGPVAYGIKAANTGEIATVLYGRDLDQVGEYLAHLVVPLYAAPQPAEPVAWESKTPVFRKFVTDSTYQKFSTETKKWYKPYKCSSCEAPQPAEMEDPNTSPLSGKGPFKTASELIDSINEPVKVPSDAELLTCTGVSKHGDMPAIFGTADIRRFAECILKHFGQRPAEPVNAPHATVYCQHPHCQTTGGCQGPCSKKQAEPVNNKASNRKELLLSWVLQQCGARRYEGGAYFDNFSLSRLRYIIGELDEKATQPAEPDEWKLAVDHELTNMQSTADSYPSAKEAVKALINWHVAVATDPVFQQPTKPVDTDLVQKWQREHGIAQAPGSREAAMVVIRHDEDGKPTVWCDPEIADLVRALNDGGVATVASCSGHGHRPGNIMLADGRALVVCKDADEAREVTSHFPGINGEAPQPAEPDYKQLFEQMCERCDALDAKLAEYSEREPVAYRLMRNNGNGVWLSDGRAWCEGRPEPSLVRGVEGDPRQWRIEYAYPAPQPAEPVKVPSDDDIEQLAKQFGFHRVPGTIELARALLARYGQPVEPEGWQLVPVELTHIMRYAGAAARLTLDDPEEDVQGIWKAMLAAAPKFGEE